MKFHNFLETALGSKVKIGVLRALCRFPGKRFTTRELARFISVSHTQILKSLDSLLETNIIKIERHGNSNLLMLNQECYLASPVKALFSSESKALAVMLKKITPLPGAKMVAFFGSVKKGDEKADSDIDILVVAENTVKVNSALGKVRRDISLSFGNTLSAIVLNDAQFRSKKNMPFARDLAKDYKVLQGDDLIARHWKR